MINTIYNYILNHINYSTSQSKPIARSNEINDFVQKNYRIMASNVAYLEDAEVVCLGECHTNKQNRIDNGKVIDLLATDEDQLLVEHDEVYIQQQNEKFKEEKELTEPPMPGQPGYDAKLIVEWTERFLRKQINHLVNNGKIPDLTAKFQAKYVTRPLSIKGWDQQAELIDGDYQNAVFNYDNMVHRTITTSNFADRNRHMCKTIEENTKPGRKVFVIAGYLHLQPSSKNVKRFFFFGYNVPFQDQAYQETIDYLKTKKFAILIPKKL